MKTMYAIVIGIGLVLAVMIYFLWGFWLGFVALTIVYVALGVCIVFLAAKRDVDQCKAYLRDEDNWFYILAGATAITFVIALFNRGSALLLPANFPTPWMRGTASDWLAHLWDGGLAPAKKIPTEPLPWATGTWFWWKAFLIYFPVMFCFFWYAFSGEFKEFIQRMTRLIEQHHNRVLAERRAAHAAEVVRVNAHNAANRGRRGHVNTPLPTAPPASLSFWEFAKRDVVMELIFKGFWEFLTIFRRP